MNSDFNLNVSTWNYICAHGNNVNLYDAISEIKSNGFGVELWRNWEPDTGLFAKSNWHNLKECLTGIKNLSVHSECVNKDWESISEEIELTSFLEADLLVVHVLNFGVIETENKLEIDEAYLKRVLDFARKHNVTLALENGFFQSLKRFCTVAGDTENMKICLDIGHANNPNQSLLSGNAIKTFIGEFGEKIIHLHIHDNHGETDEHLIPGEGNIDWHAVIQELRNSNIPLSGTLELRGNISNARKAYLQASNFLGQIIKKSSKE